MKAIKNIDVECIFQPSLSLSRELGVCRTDSALGFGVVHFCCVCLWGMLYGKSNEVNAHIATKELRCLGLACSSEHRWAEYGLPGMGSETGARCDPRTSECPGTSLTDLAARNARTVHLGRSLGGLSLSSSNMSPIVPLRDSRANTGTATPTKSASACSHILHHRDCTILLCQRLAS